jgi:hypothetical protein
MFMNEVWNTAADWSWGGMVESSAGSGGWEGLSGQTSAGAAEREAVRRQSVPRKQAVWRRDLAGRDGRGFK